MGGSATVGNHTAVAEFNVLVDPEAVHIVLGCGAPRRMAGLDLTHQFVLDDELEADVRRIGGARAVVIADLMAGYLDTVGLPCGPRRGGLHDPCAILAITQPEVDAEEGGAIRDVPAATCRKRWSRARERVRAFLSANCGLVSEAAARRADAAQAQGRVDGERLQFSSATTVTVRATAERRTLHDASELLRRLPEPVVARERQERIIALLHQIILDR